MSKVNLINTTDWRWGVVIVFAMSGLYLASRKRENKRALQLSTVWMTMTLPVMLFPRSLDLPQLYIGSGLAVVVMMTLALKGWWESSLPKMAVQGVMILLVLVMMSTWFSNMHTLVTNQDVFYRTIQDDLNYQDQRAALAWIHQDSAGRDYRFTAYAIPYFQEHGWQYLHRYFYGDPPAATAQMIYLAIEKPVEPFWVKEWTEDLGETKLLDTQKFGELTVQKLELSEEVRKAR